MRSFELEVYRFRYFFFGFAFGVLTSVLAGILYFLA